MMVIRADGSKRIGMGHLGRASLIAGAFEARGHSATIALKENPEAKEFLSGRAGSLHGLGETISFEDELNALRDLVKSTSAPVFVLDVLNYSDYFEFLGSLKKSGCLTVVVFDDVERTKVEANIAVNGNPCQLGNDYGGYPGTYLMGPRYFIMDERYKDASVRPPGRAIRDVLVTVGGADHNDLLFKLIGAFEAFGKRYHLKIFSTSSTGYVDRLRTRLGGSRLSHELFLDVRTLVPYWAGCDVAVTAGGNTLFERIATRLPGATLCQLDLQMKIADAFESMGVNVNLGLGVDIDERRLSGKLEAFLNDFENHVTQHAKAADVVDGRGLNYLMETVRGFQ